jgi:cytoskeletal protein RodZ
MQRQPFKKRRKWPKILLGLLIAVGLGAAAGMMVFSPDDQSQQARSSSSQKASSAKSSSSAQEEVVAPTEAEVTQAIQAADDVQTTEVPEVTAEPAAVSEALSAVQNDATGEVIATQPAEADQSSVEQSSSSQQASSATSTPAATQIGNWTKASFDQLALGSVTYDQVRGQFGNPTYLTADQSNAYAIWQGDNGAKVTVVFAATGSDDDIQLIAAQKAQEGLQ